jgi:cytolysin (calcineurin-like family phosphatase)
MGMSCSVAYYRVFLYAVTNIKTNEMHCFGGKNRRLPVINLLYVSADICTQLEDRSCLLVQEYGKARFEEDAVTQEERSYCNMSFYRVVECRTDLCIIDCAVCR